MNYVTCSTKNKRDGLALAMNVLYDFLIIVSLLPYCFLVCSKPYRHHAPALPFRHVTPLTLRSRILHVAHITHPSDEERICLCKAALHVVISVVLYPFSCIRSLPLVYSRCMSQLVRSSNCDSQGVSRDKHTATRLTIRCRQCKAHNFVCIVNHYI